MIKIYQIPTSVKTKKHSKLGVVAQSVSYGLMETHGYWLEKFNHFLVGVEKLCHSTVSAA